MSARALQLEAPFTNTKLEQFGGVKPYCTRLKTLADSLKNVGDKVSDNRMALQLLKGLSEEYKPFRTSIRHLNPLLSFDTLRSMLELEEQGNAANITKSHEEAHVSTVSHTTIESLKVLLKTVGARMVVVVRKSTRVKEVVAARVRVTPTAATLGVNSRNNSRGVGWTLIHGPIGIKAHGPHPLSVPSQGPGPAQWAPFRSGQVPPQPGSSQQQGVLGPRPPQAYFMYDNSSSPVYMPTNIGQAMNTMSMVDLNYYMAPVLPHT
ncbi:Transposon Ty1-DR3 Gag polyprotein [Bienertia sinuspersici]